MPFVPVANVGQVRIEGRLDNQLTINDLYFEVSGGGITPTNLTDLAQAADNWAAGQLALQLSEDWTYVRSTAIDLTSATGPVAFAASTTPGSVASESAPGNVAACVSLRTAQRGRSGRGRNFVPGIPGSVITLNTLSPTFISNLLLVYNSIIGPGAMLAGFQMVIVSRFTLGAPRVTPLVIPVTEATMVANTVRSMRSREVGHGA